MKKHSGCFGRILGIFIVLGILGAAGLGYLGFNKANEAEAAAIPVAELRSAYIGDAAIAADEAFWEEILADLTGNSEVIQNITAALGDSTVAEMIVKSRYLPDDDTVSTAIAQKILTHRLTKTYTNEELLYIYSNMMNYALPTPAPNSHADLLTDILNYLTEQNIMEEETKVKIEKALK